MASHSCGISHAAGTALSGPTERGMMSSGMLGMQHTAETIQLMSVAHGGTGRSKVSVSWDKTHNLYQVRKQNPVYICICTSLP